jgi:signal transduction histidine kinase
VLAGLHLNLNALHGVLRRDADCADRMLSDVQLHLSNALTEVRRLVYELRPPLLDALGLVGALRHFADNHTPDIDPAEPAIDDVRITIDAPESLPALPAAVEIAVYRIALEAMTNVVRHARARVCAVRLGVQRQSETRMIRGSLSVTAGWQSSHLATSDRLMLCLEITDDGIGLAGLSGSHTGIGLASMRERASELGGSCVFGSNEAGGTRVAAYLPLGAAGEELI